MSISNEDIEYVSDLFDALAPITTRKMFGGLTIYSNGLIFSLLDSTGQLYLKAAGDLAVLLEKEGSSRFNYVGKNGKSGHMNYWTMPNAALDDPELAAEWAQRALRAAHE